MNIRYPFFPRLSLVVAILITLMFPAAVFAAAPRGKPARMTDADKAALQRLGKEVNARIIWSSSRLSGMHDIFIMNADGSDKHPLVKSRHVDWFPRFSPDGKQVVFTRSKMSWTSEANAFRNKRWDIYVINTDGSGEKKIVPNACWGIWTEDGKSVFYSRNDKAYVKNLESGEEKLVLDGSAAIRPGVILQQPEFSPDKNYLSITLRGRRRETGIWDIRNKSWSKAGVGCEISWFPSGDAIYWINPSGNGGSETFRAAVKDGKLVNPKIAYKELRWVDLPGKRSHEYFPKVSEDGKWLVWCATIYGHDHDIYDYEVYCWRIGTPIKNAVRVTFYSSNDRWPDIYVVKNEEGAKGE